MKAILMSIRPQWIAKILNGEKTIEIRKKFPKDYVGWVYIYNTKDKDFLCRIDNEWNTIRVIRGAKFKSAFAGKVIARFWCDKVEEILPFEEYESPFGMAYKLTKDKIVCCQKAQLTYDEYNHYLKGKKGCAIHISDLEIFDKPKEISEFNVMREYTNCGRCPHALDFGCSSNDWCKTIKPLTRAPQSYCFIEI